MTTETQTELTIAENIKFNLEFMCFMLAAGRDEKAVKFFDKAMLLTQQLIDEGK